MFIERFKLNSSEEAALKNAIAAFQSSLAVLRTQATALLRTKEPGVALTESDNELLAPSLATYHARVLELGRGLLQSVRPATAEKIRAAIERKPY